MGTGITKKDFPLFGMGTGITKKLSCSLGRQRETQKNLPAVQEREIKAFPLGNIREREIPLMPDALTTKFAPIQLFIWK